MRKRLLSIVTIVMLLATMFSFDVYADEVTTLNDITDKNLGDKVTITGTNTIEGATLQVKRPNGTTLYVDVLDKGSFIDIFTLPIESKTGTYTVTAGKGTNFATKTFNVLSEPVIKKDISKVEDIDDITVAYGTSFNELPLPNEVEVTLEDDTKQDLKIDWKSDGYKSDEAGTYILSGTIELPANETNNSNIEAKVKVIVKEKAKEKILDITSVGELENITVEYGTEYSQIFLPSEVEVTLEDDTKQDLKIDWKLDGYKSNEAGTYILSGTIERPVNVTNNSKIEAKVSVTVKTEKEKILDITSVEELGKITVEYGTDYSKLILPDEIEVTLEDDTKQNLKIDWKSDGYKSDEAGTYILSGTIELPANVTNNSKIEAKVSVTVKEKEKEKILDITSVEDLGKITVEYGTDYSKLILPDEVEVTLDDDTKQDLKIDWKSDGYKSNEAGTYILSGIIEFPANVTNNSKIEAKVKVIVNKRKSSSDDSSSSKQKPTKSKIEADKDGNVKVVISTKAPLDSKTLEKAFKEAKQDKAGFKELTVKVPEVKQAKQYTVEVPSDSISSNTADKKIVLDTVIATVTVQNNMFKSSQVKGKDKIGFSIGIGDKSELNQEVRDKIGNRPIITINAKSENKIIPWNNPSAPAMVTINYKPTKEELKDPEHIVVWYIDGEGKVIPVPNGKYDVTTGKVTFTTTHFSKYAVSFVQKTFNDISNISWAKKEIEVMASKGVINGTSQLTYSPKANISRADFMCLLIRTLGLTAEVDSNFNDVKTSEYYYEAIGVAKKLGVTTGVGNNKFNPKEEIDRQDMMVFLAKALNIVDKTSEIGTDLDINKFNDAAEVSNYAVKGITSLIKEGIIKGNGNTINPKGKATRAETAVIMYRVLNK